MITSPMLEKRRRDAQYPLTPATLAQPIEIAINPFLTNTERQIFLWVYNMSGGSGGYRETNENIADGMGKCLSTISNSVVKLLKYKYFKVVIKRVDQNHASRSIYIDNSFYEAYRSMVEYYYDNRANIKMKDLNAQLKLIIKKEILKEENEETGNQPINFLIGCANQPIKKLIVDYSSDSISTKDNTDLNSSLTEVKEEVKIGVPPEPSSGLSFGDSSWEFGSPKKRFNRPPIQQQVESQPVPVQQPPVKRLITNGDHHVTIDDVKAGVSQIAVRQAQVDQDEINANKQRIKELKAAKKLRRKNAPAKVPTNDELRIMEHWQSLGFKRPDPDGARVTFNDSIDAIRKVQTGKLIPGETRTFAVEEIKRSMDKMSMYVFDQGYGGEQDYKDKLKKISLASYFYTPYLPSFPIEKEKFIESYFIKFIDEEVQKNIQLIEPKSKGTANRFCGHYAKATGKSKLSIKEKNFLAKTADELSEICEKHGYELSKTGTHITYMADLLVDYIDREYIKNGNLKKLKPWSYSYGINDVKTTLINENRLPG